MGPPRPQLGRPQGSNYGPTGPFPAYLPTTRKAVPAAPVPPVRGGLPSPDCGLQDRTLAPLDRPKEGDPTVVGLLLSNGRPNALGHVAGKAISLVIPLPVPGRDAA